MAYRMMELTLPDGTGDSLDDVLVDDVADIWRAKLEDGRVEVKLLVTPAKTEAVLDKLENRYGHMDDFRVVLMSVDMALPKSLADDSQAEDQEVQASRTVSRQELLGKMARDTRVSSTYIIMVVLSVVVASIGLIYDNVAVLIAAMIIAPLLGANMALALATTTGDGQLAANAIRVNGTGVGIGLGLSILLGMLLPGELLQSVEINSRTMVRFADFPLALAAGAAGTLAFTTGVSGTLIGVMVAVALMPPLIVVGMMVGEGDWTRAGGALLLLATNLICLNLAAVLTFWLQGVRPRKWWEASRAKKAMRWALGFWIALLVALIVVVLIAVYDQGLGIVKRKDLAPQTGAIHQLLPVSPPEQGPV